MIVIVSILLGYIFMILAFSFFLGRQESIRLKSRLRPSLIVPFRNEEERINTLLNSINLLDVEELQIIFVDDHSEDNTRYLIENFDFRSSSKIQIISQDELLAGKKHALIKGHSLSEGDVIFHTDADAIIPLNWITDHLAIHQGGADLVLGPHISKGDGVLAKMQNCEQIVLSGIMMASSSMRMPFLASGANISVKKEALPESIEEAFQVGISSGDDVFLLKNLKDRGKRIAFSKDSVVFSAAEKNAKSWFYQRIRWAGKQRHMAALFPFLVGILVFSGNLSFWLGVGYCAFYPCPEAILPISLFSKVVIDILFLFLSASAFRVRPPFGWVLPSSLVFSLSVILMPLLGFVIQPMWKGRRVDH